jgi:hypothetical protein
MDNNGMLHNLQNDNSIFPSRVKSLLPFGSLDSILFGVQIWLISYNGNATPFWDQWDAEANGVYRAYLNHTLTFRQMLNPHNEHRILTTRLLALLLLKVSFCVMNLSVLVGGSVLYYRYFFIYLYCVIEKFFSKGILEKIGNVLSASGKVISKDAHWT